MIDMQIITSFLALPPLWRIEGRALSLSNDQHTFSSPPKVVKLEQKTLLSLKGFGSSKGIKDQILTGSKGRD